MIKKFLTVILCGIFLCSLLSMSVSAESWVYEGKNFEDLGHISFENSWEDYGRVRINGYLYNFTFGFNTWLTNEDFIDEVYSENNHGMQYYGYVRNSEGETDVTNIVTNITKTGKADVVHTGNYVAVRVYSKSA